MSRHLTIPHVSFSHNRNESTATCFRSFREFHARRKTAGTVTRYSAITKEKHVRYFREHYRLETTVKVSRLPVALAQFVKARLYVTYGTYVGRGTCTKPTVTGLKCSRASSALEKTKSTGIGYQPGNEITMPLEKKISSYRRPFVHSVRE